MQNVKIVHIGADVLLVKQWSSGVRWIIQRGYLRKTQSDGVTGECD